MQLCHTPSMITDVSGLRTRRVSVECGGESLLRPHVCICMGEGLADGISQGNAGPDQFRTAPLWGVGQRAHFLVHDGRTSDLSRQAIQAHASRGSEANSVIRNFNNLTVTQQRDLLNFLRSL